MSAAAAVAVVAAGGAALASIPDSGSGVFHGCYSTTTGALRLIDPSAGQACAAGENAVTWDQAGIRWRGLWGAKAHYKVHDAVSYKGSSYLAKKASTGIAPASSQKVWAVLAKKGAMGLQGPAGPQGPAGVSVGASAQANQPVNLGSGSPTLVMTSAPVTVTGTYYVSTSLQLLIAANDLVACGASSPDAPVGSIDYTVGPSPDAAYYDMPITAALTVNAGDAVSVTCLSYNSNPNTIFVGGAITAMLVSQPNSAKPAGSRAAEPKRLPRP